MFSCPLSLCGILVRSCVRFVSNVSFLLVMFMGHLHLCALFPSCLCVCNVLRFSQLSVHVVTRMSTAQFGIPVRATVS